MKLRARSSNIRKSMPFRECHNESSRSGYRDARSLRSLHALRAFREYCLKAPRQENVGLPLGLGVSRRCIADGIDGLLFEKENISQLAESLERAIEDKDLRDRMGVAARERVAREFSASDYLERFTELVSATLAAREATEPATREAVTPWQLIHLIRTPGDVAVPPPRILQVLHCFRLGGSELFGLELSRQLVERGAEVLCGAIDRTPGPLIDRCLDYGIQPVDLGIPRNILGRNGISLQLLCGGCKSYGLTPSICNTFLD